MTLNNTVYATGEGTPLVLVHAFPVDHRMWDDCAEQIARQARETGDPAVTVWAPDMPGAGTGPIPEPADSGRVAADGALTDALDLMADAYVDLVRAAGYDKAVWAGLSMGGYVVLDIQRRHPEHDRGTRAVRHESGRRWPRGPREPAGVRERMRGDANREAGHAFRRCDAVRFKLQAVR